MRKTKGLLLATAPAAVGLVLIFSLMIITGHTFAWFGDVRRDIDLEQGIMGVWFDVRLDEDGRDGNVVAGTRNIEVENAFPIGNPSFTTSAVPNLTTLPVYQEYIYRFAVRNVGTIAVNIDSFEVLVEDSWSHGEYDGDNPLSGQLRFSVRTAAVRRYSPSGVNNVAPAFGLWSASEYLISRHTATLGDNLLEAELDRIVSRNTHPQYRELRSIAASGADNTYFAIVFEVAIWLASSARLDEATYVYDGERLGKAAEIGLRVNVVQNPNLP